jgi:stearoyl-CoA desaturase (Delta-9 desaturase)
VSTNIDLDHDDIMYPDVVTFLAIHVGCIAAIWSGVTWQSIAICVWWAAKHRHHHLHSDTEHDVHSPQYRGFASCQRSWSGHSASSLQDGLGSWSASSGAPAFRITQRSASIPSRRSR